MFSSYRSIVYLLLPFLLLFFLAMLLSIPQSQGQIHICPFSHIHILFHLYITPVKLTIGRSFKLNKVNEKVTIFGHIRRVSQLSKVADIFVCENNIMGSWYLGLISRKLFNIYLDFRRCCLV